MNRRITPDANGFEEHLKKIIMNRNKNNNELFKMLAYFMCIQVKFYPVICINSYETMQLM